MILLPLHIREGRRLMLWLTIMQTLGNVAASPHALAIDHQRYMVQRLEHPLVRHAANHRQTKLFGGRSLSKSRQAKPPRSAEKIALTISRNGQNSSRPVRLGADSGGSTRRHSASVKSVSDRSPCAGVMPARGLVPDPSLPKMASIAS